MYTPFEFRSDRQLDRLHVNRGLTVTAKKKYYQRCYLRFPWEFPGTVGIADCDRFISDCGLADFDFAILHKFSEPSHLNLFFSRHQKIAQNAKM
jgi:hypothetical protein